MSAEDIHEFMNYSGEDIIHEFMNVIVWPVDVVRWFKCQWWNDDRRWLWFSFFQNSEGLTRMNQSSSATHGHFLSKLRQKSVNKLDFLSRQNISRPRNDLAYTSRFGLLMDPRLATFKSLDKYPTERNHEKLKSQFRSCHNHNLYRDFKL